MNFPELTYRYVSNCRSEKKAVFFKMLPMGIAECARKTPPAGHQDAATPLPLPRRRAAAADDAAAVDIAPAPAAAAAAAATAAAAAAANGSFLQK